MHFSVNGLDFQADHAMVKVEFDIILETETWLTTANEVIKMFPGYTSYNSIQERRRGGGFSVLLSNKFESNHLHDHSFNYDCLKSVCVNVKKVSKNIVLATYYRPPVDSLQKLH